MLLELRPWLAQPSERSSQRENVAAIKCISVFGLALVPSTLFLRRKRAA